MDYSIFKESIVESMYERFGRDCDIKFNKVLKNNGIVLDGITVKRPNSKISPTVYVNDMYDDFLRGRDFNEICNVIEDMILENQINKDIDVDSLIGFENVKDKIVYKLINFDQNEELLKTVPHRKYLDLAVVFYILLNNDDFDSASILINNDHLKMWNMNLSDIEEIAKRNSPLVCKAQLKSMYEVLKEYMNPSDFELIEFPEDNNMFVLSNENKLYGAATILYENIIGDFAKKMGCDLYILPSSVHEVIIIPSDSVQMTDKLNEMICEVNESQLPKSEVLSDHFYYYDKAKKCITF